MNILQEIEEYKNTVEEHQKALGEIKNFILSEAFNSGGDLKEWLESFGFGKDNMMWPIPTIVENECEICVTFYYLPQIKAKDISNQIPRPFPLPSNPINITWEKGFPKLESNWKFELFPQPPVTICYRKDRPECRKIKPKLDCTPISDLPLPLNNQYTWEDLNLNEKPSLPCDPDYPNQPKLNEPVGEPDKSYLVKVWEISADLTWGLIEKNKGSYVERNYYRDEVPGKQKLIKEIVLTGPITVYEQFATPANYMDCYLGETRFTRYGGKGNFYAIFAFENKRSSCCFSDQWNTQYYRRYDAGWGYTFIRLEIIDLETGLPLPSNPNPPTSTNPPIDQETPMECCEECLKLLRKMDRDITRLMKWTGATSDGVKFPEYIQNKEEQGWLDKAWDLITPDAMREIKSIPEYWKYSMEKFMEVLGLPPYKIEDKNGNQLAFPTVSSLLTNQMNKLIVMQDGLDLAHLALAKSLLEIGLTRQQAIYATSLINSIIDWANIEIKEQEVNITHQFAFPPAKNVSGDDVDTYSELEEFLMTTEWKTKESHFDSEKDLGKGRKPEHFGDVSRRLLRVLEILNGVHGVRVDPSNIEGSIRTFLNEYRYFSKGQRLDGKVVGDDDTNDTSVWKQKVELEFGSEINPPVGSTDNPWGNSTAERPRIIIRGEAPTEPDDMK